jgi:hypothetical protein
MTMESTTWFAGLTSLPIKPAMFFFLFLILEFSIVFFYLTLFQYCIGEFMIYFYLFSIGLSRSQINIFFRVDD